MPVATSPTMALWTTRHKLVRRLSDQRLALAALCGCVACDDADARTELQKQIRANMTRLMDLSDAICERKPTCNTPS